MEEPDRQKIRELLNDIHAPGVPAWTIKDILEAHQQLKNLYEHWYREELNENNN